MALIDFFSLTPDKALKISFGLLAEFQKNGIANLEGEMQGTNLFRAYIPDPFTGTGLVGDGGYFLLGARDTTNGFTWPGGTPDIGELPTNAIGGIGIQDIEPNSLVANFSGLNIMPSALLAVHTKTDLAELLFKGDDVVSLNDQPTGTTLYTYGGDDEVNVFNSNAKKAVAISVHGGNGNDTLHGEFTMARNSLFGDAGNDILYGGNLQDSLAGGNGNDMLDSGRGNDKVSAGAGNDTVIGGEGIDVITGGGGTDTFVFNYIVGKTSQTLDSGLKQGQRDVVTDFKHGTDHLDIGHPSYVPIQPDLSFIGSKEFTRTDQIRYEKVDDHVLVYVNIDKDLKADFAFELDHVMKLTAGDFLL